MRSLCFDKSLYDGDQIDAALSVYARFGSFEQRETDDAWVVEIRSGSSEKERRLAGELANYALGLTIRNRKTQPQSTLRGAS